MQRVIKTAFLLTLLMDTILTDDDWKHEFHDFEEEEPAPLLPFHFTNLSADCAKDCVDQGFIACPDLDKVD